MVTGLSNSRRSDTGACPFSFAGIDVQAGDERILLCGKPLKLAPLPARALKLLVIARGGLVSRESLVEDLWPDNGEIDHQDRLNHVIRRLRAALEEHALLDGGAGPIVETEPGYGYRVVAPDTMGGIDSGGRFPGRFSSKVLMGLGAVFAGIGIGWGFKLTQPAMDIALPEFHSVSQQPETVQFLEVLRSSLISGLAEGGALNVGVLNAASAHILEGGLITEHPPHTVVLRLVDHKQGKVSWSSRFRQRGPLDEFSSRIVRESRIALYSELLPEESDRMHGVQQIDSTSVERYRRAVVLLDKGHTDQALTSLRRILDQHPDYAPAHATLAQTLIHRGWFSADAASDFVPQARLAATHAMELDDSLAQPYLVMANLKAFHDWDWLAAEALYQKAIGRNPGYAQTYVDYAGFLLVTDRIKESREAIRTADFLAPVSPGVQGAIGNLMYYMGDYDRAHVHLDNALSIEPDNVFHAGVKTCAYIFAGDYRHADSYLSIAQARQPDSETLRIVRAMLLLELRNDESSRQVLSQVDMGGLSSVGTMMGISVLLTMRDLQRAYDRFDAAFAQRLISLPFIKVHPAYEVIRGEDRYVNAIRRMGL